MKTKTPDLIGPALDWAVAKCEKLDAKTVVAPNGVKYIQVERPLVRWRDFEPSTDWAIGGPILERGGINLKHLGSDFDMIWAAFRGDGHYEGHRSFGPTSLIAAMRCHVAHKLGNVVEVPDELC